jgi:hypothetical protein
MAMSLSKDKSAPFDISERRRAEEALEALRASEERLHLSLEAAGLGHWDFDFASPLFSHYLLNEARICEAVC